MDEQINIEAETLGERQKRHAKHQRMLQDHRDAKALARERHKLGWHKIKIPPNCYI